MSNKTQAQPKTEEVKAKVEEPVSKGEISTLNANVPAAFSLDDLAKDAGAGSQEVTAQDLATPIIYILQSNSPQCKRSDGKYIAGAIEGMFYNNVTNEVFNGDEGITVIPCFFEKLFLEWKPNRGGFAGAHDADTPLREQVKMIKDAEGKEVPTLPNGNNLIETNQHYVLIVNKDGTLEPAVIAMASSALKSSRIWNSLMKRVQLQDSKGNHFNPATYYMKYKVTTKARQKDQYSWFGWGIESIGPVENMSLYNAGKALEKAVNSGTIKVKQEQVDDAAPAGATHVTNEEDPPLDF